MEIVVRRSPYGERGLKFAVRHPVEPVASESLSLRRAWIEIIVERGGLITSDVALLTESVD